MTSPHEEPPEPVEEGLIDAGPIDAGLTEAGRAEQRPADQTATATSGDDSMTTERPVPEPTPVTDFDIRSLDVLGDVEVMVTAELGRTSMCLRDVIALLPGMVIEIGRSASDPIDMLVGGRLMGQGEVVVIDEQFGVRVTDIALSSPHADSGVDSDARTTS